LGLQAIAELTTIDERNMAFARSHDTAPSLANNFKELIAEMKKVHDRALARLTAPA